MCHVASSALLQGKNVLYITLEMAEEKIAERIDANLLNVNIQDITDLPKPMFDTKVEDLAKKTQGTLSRLASILSAIFSSAISRVM